MASLCLIHQKIFCMVSLINAQHFKPFDSILELLRIHGPTKILQNQLTSYICIYARSNLSMEFLFQKYFSKKRQQNLVFGIFWLCGKRFVILTAWSTGSPVRSKQISIFCRDGNCSMTSNRFGKQLYFQSSYSVPPSASLVNISRSVCLFVCE